MIAGVLIGNSTKQLIELAYMVSILLRLFCSLFAVNLILFGGRLNSYKKFMSVLSKQCIFTPTRKNTLARDTLESDTNSRLREVKILSNFS